MKRNDEMVIVFGYHNLGIIGIKSLIEKNLKIGLVITHKDNPKENTWFSSVADFCEINNIEYMFYEDSTFKNISSIILNLKPTLILSIYFRKIIPNEILCIPTKGSVNLHGSLLPKYRGRSPVNWQILNGETEGGVTIHYMVNKADAGDIICQKRISISETDDPKSLYVKIEKASEILIKNNIIDIFNGTCSRFPQKELEATYFGGRKPEDGYIKWKNNVNDIYNLVRAVTKPYPGAFTYFNNEKIIIWEVEKVDELIAKDQNPGNFKNINNNIYVRCNDGSLIIKKFDCDFFFNMLEGSFS